MTRNLLNGCAIVSEEAEAAVAHEACCEHWTQGPSSLLRVKPENAKTSDMWAFPTEVANAWRATP
jgi:hypothetical protein